MKPLLRLPVSLLLILLGCNDPSKLVNGNIAPDFTFTDIGGGSRSLSSFKGKIILIDFWASWCKPCRKENPKLVALYAEYAKTSFETANGFEILSISLDSKEADWKEAIERDKLQWPYHTSELKGWESSIAKSYNVNSIPSNYLVDENGIIIGKDLRLSEIKKILIRRTKPSSAS